MDKKVKRYDPYAARRAALVARYIPVRVTGKLDGIPIRPLVVGLAGKIETFLGRYDDDGVKRTIKIDECERKKVSRELARHLAGS